jgi:hypothetical protein
MRNKRSVVEIVVLRWVYRCTGAVMKTLDRAKRRAV